MASRGQVSMTLPPRARNARSTAARGSVPFSETSATTLLEPRPTMGSISPVDGMGRRGIVS